MTTVVIHVEPVCKHCGSGPVIRGDGEQVLVCRRCVRTRATVAGDPLAFPATAPMLASRSCDVVALVGARWVWTVTWPGAGDLRTIRGRMA